MEWVAITTADIRDRLSDAEYTAVESKSLDVGQADPWVGLIADAVAAARGSIAGNPHNVLGLAGTLPPSAVRHALAWIVWDGLTRFRLSRYTTPEREKSYDAANRFFDNVAAGKIGVEKPDAAADVEVPNRVGGVRSVDAELSTKRRATRGRMDGL